MELHSFAEVKVKPLWLEILVKRGSDTLADDAEQIL